MENAINRMAEWHRSVHHNGDPKPTGPELLDESTFGLETEVQELREEVLGARKAPRENGRFPLRIVRNLKEEIVDIMLRCVGAFEAATEMEPGKPITLSEAIQNKVNHTITEKYPAEKIKELRKQGMSKEEALSTLKTEYNKRKAEANQSPTPININRDVRIPQARLAA